MPQATTSEPAATPHAAASQSNWGGASPAFVDGGSEAPAPGLSGSTHTVVHGDTLSGIAEAKGMSLQHLEALNPQIEDPDFILPGWKVNLGSGGSGMPTHSSYANSGEPVAHADPAPGAVGNSNNSVSEDPVNKAAAALGHDHGGHEGDKIVPAKPIG